MRAGRPFPRCCIAAVFALLAAFAAGASETAKWLDRAADSSLDQRGREYAAERLLMLADPSASILIAALRDTESGALRRQVAATLLGELAPPEAEAALLEAAFGEDYFLAEAAKTALTRLYANLSDNEIYTLLTRGARERYATPGGAPPDDEDWLAISMARSRAQGSFKALVMRGLARKYAGDGAKSLPEPLTWRVWDALLDADPDLRLAGVAMLPRIAASQATEKLAGLLYTENDVKVLIAALRAMRTMRPPDYGEAVERQTRHADPNVALEALGALDAMGYGAAMFPGAPGMRSVAGFVNHPSTPVRRRAIELLIESKHPAALEHLETALFDRVGGNRALAAWGLGEMGLGTAVGALSPLLRDGRPEVRREAAVALSRLGVVGVAARVLDDLAGGSLPFRLAAIQALGRMGDGRAADALIATLADENGELACAAAEALGRLKSRKAGAALFAAMRGAADTVFGDACRRALRDIYLRDPGFDPAGWERWAEETLP